MWWKNINKINIGRLALYFLIIIFLGLLFYNIVKAIPPFSPYSPGETLDPNCSPGDTNCTVLPSLNGTSTAGNVGFYIGTTTLSGSLDFFWDNSNKRLGIGTSTPLYKLTVIGGDIYGSNNFYINGKVGISTTTPSSKLTVLGDIFVSETSTLANILPISDITYSLGSPSLRWANIYTATGTFGGSIIIGSNTIQGTATTTLFTTGNTNQLVLGADGNIGIGTTTPSGLLDVGGGRLVVTSSGNVGIGTVNPIERLDVVGNLQNILSANSPPVRVGAVTLTNETAVRSIAVSGRYAYITTGTFPAKVVVVDISNPASPTRVGAVTLATDENNGTSIAVSGRYAYVTTYAFPTKVVVVDIIGIEASSLMAHSLEAGSLQVRKDLTVYDHLRIGGGINVGPGGIYSAGPLSLISGSTGSSLSALDIRNSAGSSLLYVRDDGNIGIGTTTPVSKLQIVGTTTAQTILPQSDNFYSLGAPGLRWANLYAATTSVGDLLFANEFRIVETDNSAPLQALIFKNQRGEEIMTIDEKGNVTFAGVINGFIEKIKQVLNSLGILIENGITKIEKLFVKEITIDTAQIEKAKINELTSKKICLEGDDGEKICIDKNQLKELLNKNNINLNNGNNGNNLTSTQNDGNQNSTENQSNTTTTDENINDNENSTENQSSFSTGENNTDETNMENNNQNNTTNDAGNNQSTPNETQE